MKRLTLTAVLLAGLGGCRGRGESTPALTTAVAAPAAGSATASLLTDDKLGRLAIYQQEILGVAAQAVGMAMDAYGKAGTDQQKFESAMSADARVKAVEEKNAQALAKSGLTQEEVNRLMSAVTEYYAKGFALRDAVNNLDEVRRRLAAAKAKGMAPNPFDTSMEAAYVKQTQRLDELRKSMESNYGTAALEAVKRHEEQFFAINEKIMATAFGPHGDKK
jgi:hypothetical protein